MNRKLTREEAIDLHKEMWTDMQAELGDEPSYLERVTFKKKWVEDHFPNEHVNSNCFLCEYAQSIDGDPYTRCRACPIAWNSNSSISPCCNSRELALLHCDTVIDYRYSPISVILALPERKVEK